LVVLSAVLGLLVPAPGAGQGPAEVYVPKAKEGAYFGKWKFGELLARSCEDGKWALDKDGETVVFRGKLKKGGEGLVVRFRVFRQPIGPEKDSNVRWVVVSQGATVGGKRVRDWQARAFPDEYRAAGKMKVTAVKNDRFYTWKVGELLGKYCDKPAWRFDPDKDRVEFRGRLKKGGAELVVRFEVLYGPVDRSNTAHGWLVLDENATLGGRGLGTGPAWRGRVFADEQKRMRKDEGEK
jgi:hypothetical protein